MVDPAINMETSATRLSAFFTDANTEKKAAETLRKDENLAGSKVELIEPGSEPEKVDKKLAPEDKNVAKTAVSSHIWLGTGGPLAGGQLRSCWFFWVQQPLNPALFSLSSPLSLSVGCWDCWSPGLSSAPGPGPADYEIPYGKC